MSMPTDALRKELESFGAKFETTKAGGLTVHIPGSDTVWHFDPLASVTASVHPSVAHIMSKYYDAGYRTNQVWQYADSNPSLAAAYMGMGTREHRIGPWRLHVSQYPQKLNGIHPVLQPYVHVSHDHTNIPREKQGGYVHDRNGDLWAAAIGHLRGEAPAEAVLDAHIEKHGLSGIPTPPVKLAAIGGATAVVRVPVPEPVEPTQQAQPAAGAVAPSQPTKPRGPVFILPQ